MQVKRNTLHVLQLVIDMIHMHAECSSVVYNFFLKYRPYIVSLVVDQFATVERNNKLRITCMGYAILLSYFAYLSISCNINCYLPKHFVKRKAEKSRIQLVVYLKHILIFDVGFVKMGRHIK